VTKISNSNTINRKDLWVPLVFLSLSFKFVFAVLNVINNYHFLSSRCIVGSGLAASLVFTKKYILAGVVVVVVSLFRAGPIKERPY
jgi:hypothetical protein